MKKYSMLHPNLEIKISEEIKKIILLVIYSLPRYIGKFYAKISNETLSFYMYHMYNIHVGMTEVSHFPEISLNSVCLNVFQTTVEDIFTFMFESDVDEIPTDPHRSRCHSDL